MKTLENIIIGEFSSFKFTHAICLMVETCVQALQMVPRSSFYIGTKVGRYEKDISKMFDFSAEKVTASFHESLKKLRLDYVDIIQVIKGPNVISKFF